MDYNTLSPLSKWALSQLRPVGSVNTSGMPVQPLRLDLVEPAVDTYKVPSQPQAGPVIPAADYELRPAAYVDHGNI